MQKLLTFHWEGFLKLYTLPVSHVTFGLSETCLDNVQQRPAVEFSSWAAQEFKEIQRNFFTFASVVCSLTTSSSLWRQLLASAAPWCWQPSSESAVIAMASRREHRPNVWGGRKWYLTEERRKIGYGNEEHREPSLCPLGSVPRVLWGSLMGMTSEVRCFTSAR